MKKAAVVIALKVCFCLPIPLFAMGTPQTVIELVREQLARDPSMADTARNVEVTAVGGNVTLRGDVNSISQREKVETVVKQANGVYYVDNQITVRGRQVRGGLGK